MVFQRGRFVRFLRRGLLIAGLVLASPLAAQNPPVPDIEPGVPEPDVVFTLTYPIPAADVGVLGFETPDLPDAFLIVSGPELLPVIVVDEEGREDVASLRVRYLCSCSSEGVFEIGSFVAFTPEWEIRTKPFALSVGLGPESETTAIALTWNRVSDSVIEGQAVGLFLLMESQTPIPTPDGIQILLPGQGLFEEAPSLVEASAAAAVAPDENGVFRLVIAAFMFIPESEGSYAVPSGRVRYGETWIETEASTFEVGPLPAEVVSSGAVGRFSRTCRLSADLIERNQSILLHVRVEGTGNFGYMRIPSPDFGGLLARTETTVNDLAPAPDGFVGSVEQTYRVTSDGVGSFRIRIPSFSWFDDATQSVVVDPAQDLTLTVSAVAEAEIVETVPALPFAFYPLAEIEKSRSHPFFETPASALLLLPGPLLLPWLVRLLGRSKRGARSTLIMTLLISGLPWLSGVGPSADESSASQASAGTMTAAVTPPSAENDHAFTEGVRLHESAWVEADWTNAIASGVRALQADPDNAPLIYNVGLACVQLGNDADAIAVLRCALASDPMRKPARDLMAYAENRAGVSCPIDLPVPLPPGLPWALVLAAWNVAFLFLALHLAGREGFALPTALFALLCAAALASLPVLRGNPWQPVRVAAEGGAVLFSIPSVEAENRSVVPAGTTLRILHERDEFLLVETGCGQRAWVRSDMIWPGFQSLVRVEEEDGT